MNILSIFLSASVGPFRALHFLQFPLKLFWRLIRIICSSFFIDLKTLRDDCAGRNWWHKGHGVILLIEPRVELIADGR